AERMLAYIACTRPSRGLTISYARTGEDGEARMPSPLLEDVQAALPGVEITTPATDEPPVSLAELASGYLQAAPSARGDAARRGGLLRTGAAPQAAGATDSALAARFGRVVGELRSKTSSGERLKWMLRGTEYQNRPGPIPKEMLPPSAANGTRQVVWRGSPSQIEMYVLCPFKHFA